MDRLRLGFRLSPMTGAVAGASAIGESPTLGCIHRGTNSGASGVRIDGFRLGEMPRSPSPSETVRRLRVSEAEMSKVKFLMGDEIFSEIETVLTRP